MTERQYKQGEIVFREREAGDSCFYIVEGRVGIYAGYGTEDEEKLSELGAGEYFGEMGLIESYPRSATVVALSDVRANEITENEIDKYFKESPDDVLKIMKQLSGRIRKTTELYNEVSEVIKEAQTPDKKEGLMDKLRNFARIYLIRKEEADGLSAENIREIMKGSHSDGDTLQTDNYEEGTVIFKEGENGTCMYVVHTGRVGIFSNYGKPEQNLITEIITDEYFGEMGMIEKLPRSATAVALEDDTFVEVFYEEDVAKLIDKNPMKLQMILQHFSYRLRRMTKEYLEACKLAYEISEAGEDSAAGKAAEFKTSSAVASM
jgi:CRP-like cAMP-binding protein